MYPKRNVMLFLVAIMMLFSLVACGPSAEDTAALDAANAKVAEAEAKLAAAEAAAKAAADNAAASAEEKAAAQAAADAAQAEADAAKAEAEAAAAKDVVMTDVGTPRNVDLPNFRPPNRRSRKYESYVGLCALARV
ncbi:MAG: hypothetical protein WHX52_04405 [Anaerolineae bacterium]